jgi:fatty-acyl-CoA synthase
MELIECKIDELLDNAVRRFGQKTAVIYQEDSYTWREIDILSDMAADRMDKRGVTRGDHVGLWSKNSAAWIVTFLALQKLGAVSALLNPNYQRRELEQAIRISEIGWLCYGSTPALAEEPDLIEIIAKQAGESFRSSMDIREESLELRKTLREVPDYAGRARAGTNCRDLAGMFYTTGTSMDPKCVLHNHYSLINNAVSTAERVQMNSDDRICVSQPLFHIFGLVTSFLGAIYCGATLCVLSRFSSEDILRCVQRHGCTILNGVPTNFIRLLSYPLLHHYRTDSLRLSIIGGASISVTQLDYIRQTFPTVRIMKNYGLTEGCNLCNSEYSDSFGAVARTVGRPYPNIEVAIRDPKRGCFLPSGERGEIVARGYNMMRGYFSSQSSGKSAQAIDDDGWLHTGDLGVIDSDGRVSIVGRIKDIIIRAGENIAPTEISREILRYEPVLDALVIGAPHPVLGEEVIACLMLESPGDYSEHELRAMLKTRLAKYKLPAFFLIYDKFPLKPSGKVDMLALREDMYSKVRDLRKDDTRDITLSQSQNCLKTC